MSKLWCPCGETICDQTDNLPYKGLLYADPEFLELLHRISRDIAAFIAARVAGTEHQWLRNYFGGETEMADQEMAHTIIWRHLIRPSMTVYQCQKCGRVHIQHRGDSVWFERFTPEATPHRDIFRK